MESEFMKFLREAGVSDELRAAIQEHLDSTVAEQTEMLREANTGWQRSDSEKSNQLGMALQLLGYLKQPLEGALAGVSWIRYADTPPPNVAVEWHTGADTAKDLLAFLAGAPCNCGSGAHPRQCLVHPQGFELHCAELNVEGLRESLKETERDLRSANARIKELETEVKAGAKLCADSQNKINDLEEHLATLRARNIKNGLDALMEGFEGEDEGADAQERCSILAIRNTTLRERVKELESYRKAGDDALVARATAEDEASALRVKVNKLTQVLLDLEYCICPPGGEHGYCPECRKRDDEEHADDCVLHKALDKALG